MAKACGKRFCEASLSGAAVALTLVLVRGAGPSLALGAMDPPPAKGQEPTKLYLPLDEASKPEAVDPDNP